MNFVFKLKRPRVSDEKRLRRALEEQDRLRREQQTPERRKKIRDLEKGNEEAKRKNKAMNREMRMNDGGDIVGKLIKFGGRAGREMAKVAREAGKAAGEMAAAADQPEPKRRGRRSSGRKRRKAGAWDVLFGDDFDDVMSDGRGRGTGMFTGKGLRNLDRHPSDL